MQKAFKINPFSLPIIFFGVVIIIGTVLLGLPISSSGKPVSVIDALFTATSATCVTGLAVVDTGTRFTYFGHWVILSLIQLGGLGIMTYTGLIFYLWTRKISLTDRLAVGQSLMHDPGFHLGTFLIRIVIWTFTVEGVAAVALYGLDPEGFNAFKALFHAVSAYCNAGFSLNSDSLTPYRGNWPINLVFMALIISGGIGFSVMMEIMQVCKNRLLMVFKPRAVKRLSASSKLVIHTSLFLIAAGAFAIYGAEFVGYHRHLDSSQAVLSSLFQSITCRTAGFNTLPVGELTNVTLVVMTGLMIIGGAPGSCAGGIKVTTFRILIAHAVAQFVGRDQAVSLVEGVDYAAVFNGDPACRFTLQMLSPAAAIAPVMEGSRII